MNKKIILAKNAEAEFVEKKSKFIGYTSIVKNEDEARKFISEIKKKNWNATHNVYGYILGDDGEIQRCSDDGEPSGTAGKPILEAIKNIGVTGVVVVITRYFCGILLGTGGLIRAYGKGAQLALEASGKEYLLMGKMICIFMDYDILGKVENYLIRNNYLIDHIQYENNAAIFCLLTNDEIGNFQLKLKEDFTQYVYFTVLEEDLWVKTSYEMFYN